MCWRLAASARGRSAPSFLRSDTLLDLSVLCSDAPTLLRVGQWATASSAPSRLGVVPLWRPAKDGPPPKKPRLTVKPAGGAATTSDSAGGGNAFQSSGFATNASPISSTWMVVAHATTPVLSVARGVLACLSVASSKRRDQGAAGHNAEQALS